MRDFLGGGTSSDKVTILRNACKMEATVRGFLNINFNFIDDAFVRDALEASHKCYPKDSFNMGTTFNVMRSCDVSPKTAAEKKALVNQYSVAGLALARQELTQITEAVLSLPTPGQGIKYIQRSPCLVAVLYGKAHWSTVYLVGYEKDVKKLMEEDTLHSSPLREPTQWTMVDTAKALEEG